MKRCGPTVDSIAGEKFVKPRPPSVPRTPEGDARRPLTKHPEHQSCPDNDDLISLSRGVLFLTIEGSCVLLTR
jgi:hypothetical protein